MCSSQGLTVWLVLLVALGLPGVSPAAEPQIAFALRNGWLEFTLQQEGKAVSEAIVRVFNEAGTSLAEGETGAEGTGSFPLSRGESFQFEVKIGDRNADPILLTRTTEGIEPARVLLSFGLRPCCRVPSRGGVYQPEAAYSRPSPSPAASLPRWIPLTAVAVCLLTGASLLLLAFRSPRGTP